MALTEVAAIREVLAKQLVFLHLQRGLLRNPSSMLLQHAMFITAYFVLQHAEQTCAVHAITRSRACSVHSQPAERAVGLSNHQQLHGFVAADSDRARDLLVSADGKCPHGVAGTTEHWLLPSQLLQHLSEAGDLRLTPLQKQKRNCTHWRCQAHDQQKLPQLHSCKRSPHLGGLLQPIAGLSHAAIENQLLNADLPHGVVQFLVGLHGRPLLRSHMAGMTME